MRKPLVSDELWVIVTLFLPVEPPKPKGGRPRRISDRATLTGILFVLKSRILWETLPQEMGCGSGMTRWRQRALRSRGIIPESPIGVSNRASALGGIAGWWSARSRGSIAFGGSRFATSDELTSIWPSCSLAAPSSPCASSASRVQLASMVGLGRRTRLRYTRDMTIKSMDNVLIVVDDLEAAKAFFLELGLELEGETTVEGSSVDRLIGLQNVRATLALMRTPDGHGRIELDKFHTPEAIRTGPENAPVNELGIRRIMFAVEDLDDVVARLLTHGAELVGEVVQYEDTNRLAYVRGPEGIIVGLAEDL